MAKSWPPKDPDEVLEYYFDWTPRSIGSDRIDEVTADVEVGAVVVDQSIAASDEEVAAYNVMAAAERARGNKSFTDARLGQLSIHWLSGGVPDTSCEIGLRIVTDQGRTLDETMKIKIKER